MRRLLKLLLRTKFSLKYTISVGFLISIYLIVNLGSEQYECTTNLKRLFYSSLFPKRKDIFSTTKFVLIWNYHGSMINNSGIIFPQLNCSVNDCVFSLDRNLLDGDYTQFDAIIFKEDMLTETKDRPKKRNSSQMYVFATMESAYNHPACELFNDNFFNLTLTYKLDSDIVWNYFIVRNTTGHVVAPNKSVTWSRDDTPLHPKIKVILRNKTKAAAWLVSHCSAESLRDEYLSKVQDHLLQYSLQIDVYGGCSKKQCPDDDCEEMLSRDYYFYMAFENSISVDYVTEKVLHGYNNYVVPIVYGGAKYSRFLPPGSFINARDLHPYKLAFLIYHAMNNNSFYESFFFWTNHYIIEDYPPDLHPLCHFCEALHSYNSSGASAHDDFRVWWNGRNGMSRCLPEEHWTESLIAAPETPILD